MVDFSLTSEQLNWQRKAKHFAKTYINGRDDLDTHGEFPRALYQQAFDEGFVTATIPKEFGGGGLEPLDILHGCEEFSYFDLGVSTSTFLTTLTTAPLIYFSTPAQKDKWLTRLTQKLTFSAFGWTEPQGSSNLLGRKATTTARKVDGGYHLNGIKSSISNASVAEVFTVFASHTDDSDGLSCFIFDKSAVGLSVKAPYKKMGQRAADTGEIIMDEVFVSDDSLIGKKAEGLSIAISSMAKSRIGISAMACGVARRARDLAITYGYQRRTGDGSLLIQAQDYRLKIAEIDAEIEAIRALSYRAAWEIQHGNQGIKFSSCAKLLGGNMANKVTNQVIEMLGAHGYMEDGIAEKLFRDAKILQIYEGPQVIQKLMIADTVCRPNYVGK